MKKIIVLGCLALLTAAVGCKKTTNVYYVDPNGNNGNQGNTYSPMNDTVLVDNIIIDSTQWIYNKATNEMECILSHSKSNGHKSYIVDVKNGGQWYETPSVIQGGGTLNGVGISNAIRIYITSPSKDAPWIPQYTEINIYEVVSY